MRIKIIFIIVFLLIMAFLPIIISKCSAPKTTAASLSAVDNTEIVQHTEPDTQSETQPQKSSELSQAELCGLVAANYDESYTQETLKALTVILYTNYTVAPDEYDLSDIEVCLPEDKAENSVKENYDSIKSAVSSVYKKTLCTNGEEFYIPFCTSTNGKTSANSDYPYLTAVASPWDCYSNSDGGGEYCGVSLNGVNYLCNEGYSFDEALLWYLPDFEIH